MDTHKLYNRFHMREDSRELLDEVMKFLMVEKENSEESKKRTSPSAERRDRVLRFPLLIPSEQSVGQYTAEGSEDRATFEQWMKKIAPEGDLTAKIAAIQQFIDSPPKDMPIPTTLSYLMFLQTFSYMIREFNASVAGFLWEPFLAAMFGGESTQVHTAEGDIADVKLEYSILTDQLGGGLQRVSLKILSPTGAVGGSFIDLVNHFAKNPKQPMVYVVIRKMPGKTKAGADIKEATMAFWQFEISQETFFTWIGQPKLEIQEKMVPYTHPEDFPQDWGRRELVQYLESEEGPLESGWVIKKAGKTEKIFDSDKKLVPLRTKAGKGSVVPGKTYEVQVRTVGKVAGTAGEKHHAKGQGAAGRIWGSEDQYAQWYALWKEMQGDPKFWQLVRGPKPKRIKGDKDPGPPGIDGPPFAPLGAHGYVESEQFEIGASYQQAVLKNPMGTINILPSVLEEAFVRGADMIGPKLTSMFNALSALIDNVGRFFLIDCGDPQAEAKTCDEKDASMRSTAGRKAIEDAATLKNVVDEKIAGVLKTGEE
jgi:hypothetical protein